MVQPGRQRRRRRQCRRAAALRSAPGGAASPRQTRDRAARTLKQTPSRRPWLRAPALAQAEGMHAGCGWQRRGGQAGRQPGAAAAGLAGQARAQPGASALTPASAAVAAARRRSISSCAALKLHGGRSRGKVKEVGLSALPVPASCPQGRGNGFLVGSTPHANATCRWQAASPSSLVPDQPPRPPHRAAASALNFSWSPCIDLSASSLVLASISNCRAWPVAAAAVSCRRGGGGQQRGAQVLGPAGAEGPRAGQRSRAFAYLCREEPEPQSPRTAA